MIPTKFTINATEFELFELASFGMHLKQCKTNINQADTTEKAHKLILSTLGNPLVITTFTRRYEFSPTEGPELTLKCKQTSQIYTYPEIQQLQQDQ